MSFDWKKTLGAVAPVLATALTGPMGGMAAKMAVSALGMGDSTNPMKDLETAVISGDPDIMLKLKQADNTFKVEMEKLNVEIKELNVKDRAGARAMAIAKGIIPQALLSAIFMGGFIFVLSKMFGGMGIEPNMMQPAMYLLGILSAGILQIMNFWFGSSSGSKEKTKNLMPQNEDR